MARKRQRHQPQKGRHIAKRKILVAGRRISVTLEDTFWNALKMIAAFAKISASELVSKIDKERQHANLSSAIRVFVLGYYQGLA